MNHQHHHLEGETEGEGIGGEGGEREGEEEGEREGEEEAEREGEEEGEREGEEEGEREGEEEAEREGEEEGEREGEEAQGEEGEQGEILEVDTVPFHGCQQHQRVTYLHKHCYLEEMQDLALTSQMTHSHLTSSGN